MATTIQASIIANGQYNGGGTPPPPVYQYLLDNYPNAIGAYSLRQLNSLYAGPAIQVRRDSDNAVTDIYFIDNELDVLSLSNFVGSSNGYVRIWYDQSGNGRDALQTALFMQPQIVDSGIIESIGTKPSIYFWSEPSWELFTPDFGDWVQFNIAFVAKADNDISSLSTVVSTYNGVAGELGNIRVQSSGTNAYYRATSTVQNIGDITYPDGSLFFNGGLVSSSNKVVDYHLGFANTGTDIYSRIGNRIMIGNHAAADRTWDGYIQELVIWGVDQSPLRAAIQNNINSYYNIY